MRCVRQTFVAWRKRYPVLRPGGLGCNARRYGDALSS